MSDAQNIDAKNVDAKNRQSASKDQRPDPALTGRDKGFWRGRWFSFRAALNGAIHTLRNEPNAWIELAAITVIVVAGWWFQVSAVEWAILGLTGFLILALEAINTAVEAVVDLTSPTYHPMAKIAKDAAAGALIFGVLGSLCVAIAIFGPRLWVLFFSP